MLATAMVGYGFVRSGGSGSGSGALRSSVAAAAVATADAPPLPPTSRGRTERLDQLYYEIEELKARNARVWEAAMALMEQDASLSVVTATVKAAESLDLGDPAAAAAAAIAANSRSLGRLAAASAMAAGSTSAAPPTRPSGGASRTAPSGGAAFADATASSAAGAAVAAGVPLRPSGGASRGAMSFDPIVSDTRAPPVPIPERPGGASARAGPPLPPSLATPPLPPARTPADSSRVKPPSPADLAALAGASAGGAAASPQPPAPPASAGDAGGANAGSAVGPAQEVLRPSFRPTRRAAARTPRTFRSAAPPPLPTPPARVNPSFDVPQDAASPQEFLKQADGVTADGRVNPSFATAEAAASAPASVASAAAATAAPPAAAATVAAQAWYNPLTWFTQRGDRREESSGTNPSFDASLAVVSPEAPAQAAPAAQAAVTSVAAESPSLPVASPGVPAATTGTAALESPALIEAAVDTVAAPNVQISTTAAAAPEAAAAAGEQRCADSTSVGAASAVESKPASASGNRPEGRKPRSASSPVEHVAELLEVAAKTEEFTYPKYDPLRNLFAGGAASSAASKYDMLRGLLRAGREAAPSPAEGGDGGGAAGAHKYDLVYDLLTSLRTSADPAAAKASGDPKYDPVWCLLHMQAPTRASEGVSKYDLVGTLLQAALAASPQPSRYDPLAVLLQARPLTGSYKYCVAETLLRGSWQQPLDAGLADLPAWDPLAGLTAAAAPVDAVSSGGSPGRRPVSKYDMVGQALEAAAALPEDLASGKWAAAQPKDPFLGRRERSHAPLRSRQRRSKYDMVGAALSGLDALPEELSSGRWAASQGRELLIDTLSRAVDGDRGDGSRDGGKAGSKGGVWGVVRGVRDRGAAALGAVAAATAPVRNFVAKAAGLPYEVAPGVTVKVEGRRGAAPPPLPPAPLELIGAVLGGGAVGPAAPAPALAVAAAGGEVQQQKVEEELPVLVFQFKDAPGFKKKTGSKMQRAAPAPKAAAAEVAPAALQPVEPVAAAKAVVPEPAKSETAVVVKAAEPKLPAVLADAAPEPVVAAGPGADTQLVAAMAEPEAVIAGIVMPEPAVAAAAAPTVTETAEAAIAALTDAAAASATAAAPPTPGVAQAPAPATPRHRLERAVVPPSRRNSRNGPPAHSVAAGKSQLTSLPHVDHTALAAALAESGADIHQDAQPAAPAPAAAAAAEPTPAVASNAPAAQPATPPPAPAAAKPAPAPAPVTPLKPVAAAAPAAPAATGAKPPAPAIPSPKPPAPAAPLKPSELAVDLLVFMSVHRSRGAAPPSWGELLDRFGPGFADLATQLRRLRADAPLLGRHPAVSRLLRAASAAAGDGTGMWSALYEMLGAVRDAEAAMPRFLADCKPAYPAVHGLLVTGDAGQAVSLLCTLCNLLPTGSATTALDPAGGSANADDGVDAPAANRTAARVWA